MVIAAGVEQHRQRILAVHRHDLRADLVGRAVQRDRQPDLQRLVGQTTNLRRQAARGNRDVPRAEADAPRRVDDADGAQSWS